MATYEGHLNAAGMRIALVCSRFNETITKQLLDGALNVLRRHGLEPDDVTVAWVPGAFELPLAAKRLAASGEFEAVVTLGAVIRGATTHYDLVAGQSAAGCTRASLDTGIPVIYGVLTTENLDQAFERSGTKAGNKGADCALAAVEMVDLLRQLPKGP